MPEHTLALIARIVGCAVCWALIACGGSRFASLPPEVHVLAGEARSGEALHYEVELSSDLSQAHVELCFRGLAAGPLIPGRSEAGFRLRSARWLSTRKRLNIIDGRIELPEHTHEGCLAYHVSLREGGSLNALVARQGPHLLASPNAWLWRPDRRTEDIRGLVNIHAPEGISTSLPWPRRGDMYELDASAFAFDSYAVFGPLREINVYALGVSAHAVLLGKLPNLSEASLRSWLSDALFIATQSSGDFPTRSVQVILVPTSWGNEPFGSVTRGGGGSVLIFVPSDFDHARLERDWVLPHELSHLLLPFIKREDAWLAEGFATYYQEVLRARAGVLTAREALDNIASSLRSAAGEGTGRTLCEESRSMHRTAAYRAVYWGGAGHWLNADIALRRHSRGRLTLDELLARFRAEARATPPYSAHEVLTRLDQLSSSHVFTELLAHCEREPFPYVEESLRALGWSGEALLHDQRSASLRRALLSAQRSK